SDKMVRRHPHVFGDTRFDSIKEQKAAWHRIKEEERRGKARTSTLDDIPKSLPALARLQKLQKRAAGVGFDWPDHRGAQAKLHEELAELDDALAADDNAAIADELGDLIMSAVNLARKRGLDAESIAREAGLKFERRFRAMEAASDADGETLVGQSLDALEARWQSAKVDECPRCLAIARERLIYFWLLQRHAPDADSLADAGALRALSLLEFSPRGKRRRRRQMERVFGRYLSSDFDGRAHSGHVRLDLTDRDAVRALGERFDLIICAHVLEHIPDYRPALAN
ncbi:unnamed protein product, partial [Cyprideis torosa]